MAQLAELTERSLPIPEVRGSNPVIGKSSILIAEKIQIKFEMLTSS